MARSTKDEAWFVYTKTAGRITARPVGLKGWLVFAAALAASIAFTWAAAAAASSLHPAAGVAALVLSLLIGLLLIFRLVLAKGRPAP